MRATLITFLRWALHRLDGFHNAEGDCAWCIEPAEQPHPKADSSYWERDHAAEISLGPNWKYHR